MARQSKADAAADELREHIDRRKVYREALDRFYKASKAEYEYGIKQNQHKPPTPKERKRGERLKVTSGDLGNILRYTAATLSGLAIYLNVKPRGPGETPQEQDRWQRASDVARAKMHEKMHDVDIGYPAVRRRVIRCAGASRAGACRLDPVPGGMEGVEIVPVMIDWTNLSWDTRYLDFNEHGCPALYEDFRIGVKEAQENPDWDWDDKGALYPDDGKRALRTQSDPHVDYDAQESGNEKITLTRVWIKDDPADMEIEVGEPTPLPSQQWHMACPTCGYSEADLVSSDGYDGSTLPQMHPCPQCGETPEGQPAAMMQRIDSKPTIGRVPVYSDKHRMLVFAPLSPGAGIGRDGPWPKGLTNFPYAMFVPDPFPLEPVGNSDTFRNQDLASMKNASLASGFEQMDRNKDILLAVENGVWDAQHEPYQFDGSGDPVAFTSPDGMNVMKQFQGSGLNPAYAAWMGLLNGELQRFPGIFQMDPMEMKSTPVGTIARAKETGDVPLDEQARILREFDQRVGSRWLEMGLSMWTLPSWVLTSGADGRQAFALFNASDMPALKLTVEASPNLDAVDLEKFTKIRALLPPGVPTPPSLIKFMLKDANIPEEVIADLIRGSIPPAMAGPGAPGQPPAGPPPEMARAGGPMQ